MAGKTSWATTPLSWYVETAREERATEEGRIWIYRLLMRQFARDFFASTRERQIETINAPRPELLHDPCDALIGGVMEHLCRTEKLEPPAWCDEPERFLREPWPPFWPERNWTCEAASTPAAFLRRGVIIDPGDLDLRVGYRNDWRP